MTEEDFVGATFDFFVVEVNYIITLYNVANRLYSDRIEAINFATMLYIEDGDSQLAPE